MTPNETRVLMPPKILKKKIKKKQLKITKNAKL